MRDKTKRHEFSELSILLLILLIVPITGEFKITPFFDSFRIGLGATLFLFYSLFVRKINVLLYGAAAGILVVIFRIMLAVFSGYGLDTAFLMHFPAFFYYFGYVLVYYVLKAEKYWETPITYGLFVVLSDFGANCIEKIVRFYMMGDVFSLQDSVNLLVISLIRSCFALAFYNAIMLREKGIICKHKEIQNKQLLLLISGLYEEAILVKKSLDSAEHLTRKCFDLYKKYSSEPNTEEKLPVDQNFLDIAKLVHEIKKDNQRIYAGLSKLITKEQYTDYMNAGEIIQVVASTNEKYALSLNRKVIFCLNIPDDLPKLHVCTLLSIVNNLVVNSVESINSVGYIEITLEKKEGFLEITVADNGKGIPEAKKELIFAPGYTTKFDEEGRPSTGIGLVYVKEIVTDLGGSVEFKTDEERLLQTVFNIRLPINSLCDSKV